MEVGDEGLGNAGGGSDRARTGDDAKFLSRHLKDANVVPEGFRIIFSLSDNHYVVLGMCLM